MSGIGAVRVRCHYRALWLLLFLLLSLSTQKTWALQATDNLCIDGFVAQGI
jgi:hypothetical protein